MKKQIKFLSVALIGAMLLGCGGGNNPKTTPPPSGSLDKSFGDNGKVITGGSQDDAIFDIISNNDGTIYACGGTTTATKGIDSFLSKYSEDGNLVSSFATNGTVLSNISKDDRCNALTKDSNGNIYVAGRYTDSSNKKRGYIAKYKPNGSLDTSFNGSGFKPMGPVSTANTVVMQNGKILVAGQYNNKAVIGRLYADGTVDSSFGNSGSLELGSGTTDDEIKDIAIDNNGKIVLVGKTVASGNNVNVALARLTPNGQVDNTFGNNGFVAYDNMGKNDGAEAIKIDSSGKILVAGYSDKAMALAKFDTDGNLDTGFGTNGLFLDTSGVQSGGLDLDIDANDNILVTGGIAKTTVTKYQMAVWRLNTLGKLDTTFNSTGIATYNGGHDIDLGYAITIDNNNKILVGGASYQGSAKESDEAIWRINP